MARVAFEDAIAELDNVAGDSYKDPTTYRKRRVSDLSLVQMTARQVEHESISRGCVECVNLTFCQRCSCTPTRVVRFSGFLQQSHPQYRTTTFIQLDGWLFLSS